MVGRGSYSKMTRNYLIAFIVTSPLLLWTGYSVILAVREGVLLQTGWNLVASALTASIAWVHVLSYQQGRFASWPFAVSGPILLIISLIGAHWHAINYSHLCEECVSSR